MAICLVSSNHDIENINEDTFKKSSNSREFPIQKCPGPISGILSHSLYTHAYLKNGYYRFLLCQKCVDQWKQEGNLPYHQQIITLSQAMNKICKKEICKENAEEQKSLPLFTNQKLSLFAFQEYNHLAHLKYLIEGQFAKKNALLKDLSNQFSDIQNFSNLSLQNITQGSGSVEGEQSNETDETKKAERLQELLQQCVINEDNTNSMIEVFGSTYIDSFFTQFQCVTQEQQKHLNEELQEQFLKLAQLQTTLTLHVDEYNDLASENDKLNKEISDMISLAFDNEQSLKFNTLQLSIEQHNNFHDHQASQILETIEAHKNKINSLTFQICQTSSNNFYHKNNSFTDQNAQFASLVSKMPNLKHLQIDYEDLVDNKSNASALKLAQVVAKTKNLQAFYMTGNSNKQPDRQVQKCCQIYSKNKRQLNKTLRELYLLKKLLPKKRCTDFVKYIKSHLEKNQSPF